MDAFAALQAVADFVERRDFLIGAFGESHRNELADDEQIARISERFAEALGN